MFNVRLTMTYSATTLLLAMFSTNARAEEPPVMLEIGDAAPEVAGLDDEGKLWRLSDSYCERYTVVYFYPGDFTSGCRKQAKSFQNNLKQLTDVGVGVVGVSGDKVETHRLFKRLFTLEYMLVADTNGKIASSFGVPYNAQIRRVRAKQADGKPYWPDPTLRRSLILERPITIQRWTFIIAPDGRIVYKNEKVNPVKESEKVLAIIRNLQKKS